MIHREIVSQPGMKGAKKDCSKIMSASKTFFFFHFLTETLHLSALDRGKNMMQQEAASQQKANSTKVVKAKLQQLSQACGGTIIKSVSRLKV